MSRDACSSRFLFGWCAHKAAIWFSVSSFLLSSQLPSQGFSQSLGMTGLPLSQAQGVREEGESGD